MEKQSSYSQMLKSFLTILLAILLSAIYTESYALVFNITPNGNLPTTVPAGSSVSAAYVIQNNTNSTRNNNFIKYLPPNVTIAGGGCGQVFNLAPNGRPGDSCILNLTVTGAVDGNDTDPHHHLFACFPRGKTCAGTRFPLNVVVVPVSLLSISVTPINSTISVGGSQQYTAMGHFIDGSTKNLTTSATWNSSAPAAAPINAAGLATGMHVGTTNITATSEGVTSNTAILNVTGFLWVTNFEFNNVFFCPVNADGSLGTCTNTNAANTFINPAFIALNNTGTIALVNSNSTGPNAGTILTCPINPDGTFGTCITNATGTLNNNIGIALNPANTFAYTTESSNEDVRVCPVNPSNGELSTCVLAGSSISHPSDIVINKAGTVAFTVNGDNTISQCFIDQTSHAFNNCNVSGDLGGLLKSPQGIAINSTETLAWITNAGTSTEAVVVCHLNASATPFLFACQLATSTQFTGPVGIVVNASSTIAYIADFANPNPNNIVSCSINPNGTFGSCVNAASSGTLAGPFGLALQ